MKISSNVRPPSLRLSWFGALALLLVCSVIAGCAAAPPSPSSKKSKDETTEDPVADDSDDESDDEDRSDERAPGKGPLTSTGPLGVVVIDVQQVFFSRASQRNPAVNAAQLQDRTAQIFQRAAAHDVPLFVTYEDSKTGDHAMPPALAKALPPSARELVKTTFAATGQPEFLPALKAAGLTRVLVTGAETDVCVLQTMLGLRRAGIEVIAVNDALFTEERNSGVALKRYRQAGIVFVDSAEALAILDSGGGRATEAPPEIAPPVIVHPLEMGIVLNDLEGLGESDPNSSPKLVRLRELLLVSEWFKLPLLAADPAKAEATLPANLKTIITRPIVSLDQRPARVKQVAIAGGPAGLSSAAAALAKSVDVFVVEDAIVGKASTDLDALYPRSIPTTYKTLYYELTVSVADQQWPSQQWVKDGDVYFDRTMALEELPPLSSP